MMSAFMVVLGLLVYAWGIYPVLILLLGRMRTPHPLLHPAGRDSGSDGGDTLVNGDSTGRDPAAGLPPVAVVFSAHNEEPVIGARIANLFSLDYPHDRLAVYIGIDGCTDRTEAIVRDWQKRDDRVHVITQTPCRGKTSMLKRLVGEALRSGSKPPEAGRNAGLPATPPLQVLVFTDANTLFERDVVRRLVTPFADSKVGGVCGKLVFENPGESKDLSVAGTDEPVYWDLETRMKEAESRLDSCLGANGAVYAIRAELFPKAMPDNTIIDDFVIGMKVREQGFRMLFEPHAIAHEDLPETIGHEWRRRIRIGAGAYQALSLCRGGLSPRRGILAWMFLSHKVLRWFTPHFLVVVLVAGGWHLGAWVARSEGWRVNLTAVGLMLVWLAGLMAYYRFRRVEKLFNLACYFVAMQAALFAGFLRFCRGNLSGAWERTER